jgi:hypothetical protein
MINRGAIIVRFKEPYIDWAIGLDDTGLTPDKEGESTVYLIPEFEDDVEALEVLSNIFEQIFEHELRSWHRDEAAWPQNRTWAMFREWFDVEFHSCVEDVCGDEPMADNEA